MISNYARNVGVDYVRFRGNLDVDYYRFQEMDPTKYGPVPYDFSVPATASGIAGVHSELWHWISSIYQGPYK
jgi:hypothetical protein